MFQRANETYAAIQTRFSAPERLSSHDLEIARAKRHTRLVKSLRVALPAATVCVASLYVVSAFNSAQWDSFMEKLPIPTILPDKLTMDNPRYSGYNDDGGRYVITAKTAAQDFTRPGMILLNGISGDLFDVKGAKTTLEAGSGEFNSRKNRLKLLDGIEIASADGMRAKLKSADILTKTGVIETSEPVDVSMPTGTLRAQKMTLWQKQKKVLFQGDVQASLTPEKPATSSSVTASTSVSDLEKPKPATGLFTSSSAPVDIKSDTLEVESQKNIALFSGNVNAAQDQSVIETRELAVHFEPAAKQPTVVEPKPAQKPTSPFGAGSQKIERIVAQYPVLIRRGADQQVTSERAEFYAIDERAILDGHVRIRSGTDRGAASDRVIITNSGDNIELVGNVIVSQAQNELRGRNLTVDRPGGVMRLTAPAGPGVKPGRIQAKLHRQEEPGNKKNNKSNDDPVGAAKEAAGGFTFKTDPSAPIVVDAESLVVENKKRQAKFDGGVIAKQGTFTMVSSTLSVFFDGEIAMVDPGTAPTPKSKKSPKNEGPDLKKIVARNRVKVTSQSGQVAEGDWAEFDVVKNTVEIGGAVTMRQDRNIVRGKRLKIDMDTGQTVIDADTAKPGDAWAWSTDTTSEPIAPEKGSRTKKSKSAANSPPAGFDGAGPRPSAVFYPFALKEKLKADKNKQKPGASSTKTKAKPSPAATSNGSSSWSATVAPPN